MPIPEQEYRPPTADDLDESTWTGWALKQLAEPNPFIGVSPIGGAAIVVNPENQIFSKILAPFPKLQDALQRSLAKFKFFDRPSAEMEYFNRPPEEIPKDLYGVTEAAGPTEGGYFKIYVNPRQTTGAYGPEVEAPITAIHESLHGLTGAQQELAAQANAAKLDAIRSLAAIKKKGPTPPAYDLYRTMLPPYAHEQKIFNRYAPTTSTEGGGSPYSGQWTAHSALHALAENIYKRAMRNPVQLDLFLNYPLP